MAFNDEMLEPIHYYDPHNPLKTNYKPIIIIIGIFILLILLGVIEVNV